MPTDRRISKRLVLYLSGFDPRGPAQFARTLARQSAKWSALTDVAVDLGPRQSPLPLVKCWKMTAQHTGSRVTTDVAFLEWDDLIRANWERNTLKAYLHGIIAFAQMAIRGVVARAYARDAGFAVTLALPFLVAVAFMAVAAAIVVSLLALLAWPIGINLVALLPLALACVAGWWLAANLYRTNAAWIGRITRFTMRDAGQQVAGLGERREQLAKAALAMIDGDAYDEVLLIGFSLGTPLAASIAARMIRQRPALAEPGSTFSMVTLGQTIPMLSDLPEAGWFRNDLSALGGNPALNWFDISSKPDGACYAATNPLSFLNGTKNIATPHLISAQFHKSIAADRMNAARRERMLMHFFYLDSPDYPDIHSGGYDFYSMLLGHMDMTSRFTRRMKMPKCKMPAGVQ